MARDEELILKLRAQSVQFAKDLSKAQKRIKRFETNVNKIGKSIQNTMLAAFGGQAILMGIQSVVRNLAEFELQMLTIKAISGATEKQFADLTDNALELGRTTKFTAGEIAGLQLALSKMGFETKSILDATDAIQKLSVVTGEELAASAQTMAGTLRSFNLTAESSARTSNVMAEAFSKTALTLEKFTVGTANSGAIANALGITLEQNTARLGTLVNANIDASKAGTDLRRIYGDLNKHGISYSTALELIRKSSDKVSAAQKLVGERAKGALVILAQQEETTKALALSLADTNTELDDMAEIIGTSLATALKKMGSAWDGLIKRGGKFNGFLKGAVDHITELILQIPELGDKTATFKRQAEESGKVIGNQFAGNIHDTNNQLLLFKRDLLNAQTALAKYNTEQIRANGEIDRQSSEYRKLISLVVKYSTAIEESESIVEENAKQLEIENELIAKQGREAEKTKNQLAALNAIKQAGAFVNTQIEGIKNVPSPGNVQAEILKGDQIAGRIAEEEYAKIERNKWDTIANEAKMGATRLEALNVDINATLKQGSIDIITSIADAIGGGKSLDDAFGIIIGIMAQNMQKIGVSMIAYGIAQEAFKASLESLNGFAAIAAGGALVAAGAALKAAQGNFSSSMSGGGGSGGGSGGRSGEFSFSGGRSLNITGEFMVKGKDLQLVLDNNSTDSSRNTAG